MDVFEIDLTRMAHAHFIETILMNERILDSVIFGFLDNLLCIYIQGLFRLFLHLLYRLKSKLYIYHRSKTPINGLFLLQISISYSYTFISLTRS